MPSAVFLLKLLFTRLHAGPKPLSQNRVLKNYAIKRKNIDQKSDRSTLADRADRTCALASAAVDASIGVDLILRIALSDSFNGAGSSTGAAADAGIINNTCHGIVSFQK